MKSVFNIARAELQTLFFSPVAWLIIIIFTFQTGMSYCNNMDLWVKYLIQGYKTPGASLDIFANQQYGLFMNVLGYLYLYIPLLTMGLMSREFASGSIKLLYSSPVTNAQIILGKFLSMIVYALVLVAVLMVCIVVSWILIKDFELHAVLMGLLGNYLLICAYAAIGLFMSSLTSYQVVAAMGTLITLAILNYISTLWQDVAFVRDLTYWVSIAGRANSFLAGLFVSEDFLYFIIVMLLFLLLAIIRLQVARQKTRWTASWGKYTAVVAIALLLGYASSRPKLMTFYDATSTKSNTLTPASQEVIKKLKGGLTITTYTNMLDDQNLWIALPRAVNADLGRFRQYTRFKPDIKMEYVYYYDSLKNPGLEKRYPNMTAKQRMEKIADLQEMSTSLVQSPEWIRKKINLLPEGNTFVRSVKRESGEQTFLRIFDDPSILPGETEITAALKRVAMPLPKVGFLRGHGERDNRKQGDRNYNRFAQDKPFRYALINQGFDVADVTLENEVPAAIDILVIADMKNSLSGAEKDNLEKYITRGGNLLIAGEAKRQHAMDELVAPFGVRFVPGELVNPGDNYLPDFIIAKPTPQAGKIAYIYDEMYKRKRVVTMPSAVGLEYTTGKGFDAVPLFVSDSTSWNEMETSDFIDDTVQLHPAAGEVQKPYVTGLALSRKMGKKIQKIIVLGDADCISNGEISISRQNVGAANYSVIMGAFFWMSDNEVPIDVRRPSSTDDAIALDKAGMSATKTILTWIFPGLLLLVALVLWIRRRGR